MSDISRLRADLEYAMQENDKVINVVAASAEQTSRFSEMLIQAADHANTALELTQAVGPTAQQVHGRLGGTAGQAETTQHAFSTALVGNSTDLYRNVRQGLTMAGGFEAQAHNTIGLSAQKLAEAAGHLVAAFEILRPDDSHSATVRMGQANAAMNGAVEARRQVNDQVVEYLSNK